MKVIKVRYSDIHKNIPTDEDSQYKFKYVRQNSRTHLTHDFNLRFSIPEQLDENEDDPIVHINLGNI